MSTTDKLNGLFIPDIGIEVHENVNQAIPISSSSASMNCYTTKPKKRTLKTYFESGEKHHTITALSYNVWFNDAYARERTLKIISIIREQMPDLIGLQELTKDTFELVDSRLSPFYQIFQAFISEGNPYGTCIMCKRDTVRIVEGEDNPYYYDYSNTEMSRRIIGCEVEFTNFVAPHFHVLTTHLESLPENDTFRNSQFEIVKKVIKPLKNCILLGDFGIWNSNEQLEQNINNSKLNDAWIKMGCPYKVKYSYNAKKNQNIKGRDQFRFDRVLYHSHLIKPKLLGLVGRNNVSNTVPLPPSNHFGLLVDFQIKDSE